MHRLNGSPSATDWPLHAAILAAAVAVPVLGLLLSTDATGHVAFAGLEAYPLPTVCPSRWLGLRCPTCGLTRSVIAAMHGDAGKSLAHHPLGWAILLQIVAQIPYRSYRLLRPDRSLPHLERLGVLLMLLTAAAVVLNFAWRVMTSF